MRSGRKKGAEFGTPDSEMKPSKSNSVNSQRENDLERLGEIGWVLGTEFATGW